MEISQNLKYEDTVQCYVFSTTSIASEEWKYLCNTINKNILVLSQNFIWHRDEFKLCMSVLDNEKNGMPCHLTSTTCFGDNIEDEWFIVYLVLEITKEHDNLIVQMEDNDGDFLLIEAADFLPVWAKPETTRNRVFIYRNHIHIIPPELIELDSEIKIQSAIDIIKQSCNDTKASSEIQEAVLRRISGYPQKILHNNHRTFVHLPLDIAALLTLQPSLISPIVTTYCNHDMLDEKCFKNITLGNNCVTVPVLFTKYLYAMILHSKSPRINKKMNLDMSENRKENMLGMKLACGYEIIMSKSSNDIFASKEYAKFINNLTKNGYFKNNIEGSMQYKELLETAKTYFSNVECPITSFYCNKIEHLKNTEGFIKVKDTIKNKRTIDLSEADNEEWLNIQPDELNTFLSTHYGKKLNFRSQETITPQTITSELTSFLKKNSDFEGIEGQEEDESDTNQIEFESDQFMSCVEKMLNIIANDNDEIEDSDFSENCDDDAVQDIDEGLDDELSSKLLHSETNAGSDEIIMKNLLQSIKEEGSSGPSSNLLKGIGVDKTELIDSDDD